VQNTANQFNQICIKALSTFALAVLFSAASTQHALAFQIPADAANTWVVAGSTASKFTPSGVRANIAITGTRLAFQLLNNVTCQAGSGTADITTGLYDPSITPCHQWAADFGFNGRVPSY
jgi:hypothetical protein